MKQRRTEGFDEYLTEASEEDCVRKWRNSETAKEPEHHVEDWSAAERRALGYGIVAETRRTPG